MQNLHYSDQSEGKSTGGFLSHYTTLKTSVECKLQVKMKIYRHTFRIWRKHTDYEAMVVLKLADCIDPSPGEVAGENPPV